MSDNIPLEIQAQIMKRLPAKSLIQFRSVSKAWKSLIDSSYFIAHYSSQVQHLVIRYVERVVYEDKYVSIVDDDNSFPQHKVSLTLPLLVRLLHCSEIIGSSHGLLCLYGVYRQSHDGAFPGHIAVIWNISIRKAVAVVVPNVPQTGTYRTTLGFGVCLETSDPKIVKITRSIWAGNIGSFPPQVEVFTLSTGAWRSPLSNLPRKSLELFSQVVIDGFLYWLATDRDTDTLDGGIREYNNLILSFDFTSEEFKEVKLPDSLAHRSVYKLSISKLGESLVVFERGEVLEDDEVFERDEDGMVFGVWMMGAGVPKSFTKLYSIYTPNATVRKVLGFRKSGEPVVEIAESRRVAEYYCQTIDRFCDRVSDYSLAIYEHFSNHINKIGIYGIDSSFKVYPYMETLLLHDQPNSVFYYNGRHCISEWFF